MAVTETYSDENSGDTYRVTIYNVSYQVGDNQDNWWTDIMLVQYFIRIIYLLNNNGCTAWKLSLVSVNDIDDLPDPHKDYKALTKTAKWIRYFQTDATLMNGYPMIANGRVKRPKSSPGDLEQPIYLFNHIYRSSLTTMGIYDWEDYAMTDASMPQMLRTQLMSHYEWVRK